MIKLEIELAKCRERTKDKATIRLMMIAKADLLDEFGGWDPKHDTDCECECDIGEPNLHSFRGELMLWLARERQMDSQPVLTHA